MTVNDRGSAAGRDAEVLPQRPGSTLALFAALLGADTGVLLQDPVPDALAPVLAAIEFVGQLWVRVLRAVVLPLMVGSLITVIGRSFKADSSRVAATQAAGVVLALLLGALAFGLAAGAVTTAIVPVDADQRARLASAVARFEVPSPADRAADESAWVAGLVPGNPFEAAARGQLLPVLVFTAMFATALRRIRPQHAEPVLRFFDAVAGASMDVVRALVRGMPVAAFALTLTLTRRAGLQMIFAMAYLVLVLLFWLTALAVVLGAITAIAGRLSPLGMVRALYPAQLMGAITRSSLTSSPAAMIVARKLGVSKRLVNFMVPLGAATFKVNQPMTTILKVLAMGHLFNVDLAVGAVFALAVAAFASSMASVGLPGGSGGGETYVLFLAAGIPAEIYWMDRAVDAIPDVMKTVVNVTGYVVAAVLLERLARGALSSESSHLENSIPGQVKV